MKQEKLEIKTTPITLEEFNHFKARANFVLDNALNQIDPRFRPTMRLLCRMSGIASVWSCSGHTAEEYAEQGYTADDSGFFGADMFYFTAVCRPGDMTQSETNLRSVLEGMVRDYSGPHAISNTIEVVFEEVALFSAFRFREDPYLSLCFEVRFENTKRSHLYLRSIVDDLNQRLEKAVLEEENITQY